ncbi:hypothetical protein FGL85_00985 [Leuconostoc pseudomesenteroides]|uniref:Peptidase S74 domain-containing protein n=1 Tax=Leuconostoc pseudomesenteroides TaxID=33968 RepID=A0A5B8T2E8_LEUPS|nr:phage tail protein [Leuconostoc pseudomesenteroides]QEA41210.1 hypothetical protein FGL85_00985 [Leuconostoc pseudomesenteroides]
MITFKNIAGNKFLAVGTIQRKSALNGEKSLTGTLYDGKDVLNKIDKGWSLEFDGEPYIVTYFERNDNDNSVSFDAIHKFFWDMTKKVLYSSTEISGSHTIKWYLDQIFANTGYTYALNFSPAAIEKDNWGNKTRLSLFNDLITSIAGEFEINGTLISIFQNIGTDLSTIVRYGFNLSDMTLENDATSFVTYGEGFGAYANQENQTGDRVHVTYTSPLAGVYGILQAEPIDDQRYTSQANLQAAVKAQVDASFSVSVQLSLYDLTAAGYPYKMANVGDWLTAVDENLDFKQRIRIISIDDEFSADGTRISYTVTAGDIGLTKKYQDANASMASQVANAIVSAGQASTDANFALIAANGKLTAYYVGSYDELPTTANEGDLGWVTSGDGRLLYIYTKKADGSYYWEKRIDPEMGDQIAAGVTEAVTQANAHTDAVKQGLSTDIATAKSQAASQASTAEANAKSAATSKFNQAQNALSAAKTDLTNSIASEASARNAAVAAANSQAQTYANQAKADAMSAASSADGVIRTAISSSANSLSATITQNKSSADSGISTAQTTAQQAVDGLKTKVSQTDYNAKTGQLQTDLTATTQTANQAKTDIVSIKQKDSDQDAKMNSIVSDANGTKQTVSDLQTTQGKQSGDISTLQQRADGFDATVTKLSTNVNSLNQINNVINSEFSPDLAGWYVRGDTGHASVIDSGSFGYNTSGYAVIDSTGKTGSDFYFTSAPYPVNAGGVPFSETVRIRTNVPNAAIGIGIVYYDVNKAVIGVYRTTVSTTGDWSLFSYSGTLPNTAYYISFDVMIPSSTLARFVISQPMIVISTTIGDYVAGSYNNNDALAKVKLTADKATFDLSTYKTDADGRISKAQADITATAKQVATKVSQTDYDTKTGQLTTSVSKAQQTADAVTTSLGNYKQDADGRISANSADIITNANAIKQKVAQSDYDANNTKLTSRLTTVETTASGTATTVSNLQQTVNALGQVNQLFNTEFSPDFSGWFIRGYYNQDISKGGWVKGHPVNGHGSISHVKQPYLGNLQSPLVNATGAGKISISAVVSVYSDDGVGNSYITLDAFNQDGTFVSQIAAVFIQNGASDKHIKLENITIPSNVSYVSLGMLTPLVTVTYKLSQTMLVFSDHVGTYVQGNYNNNAALAQVKITADGINSFVRDSSGNISSDFQTALSKTSIITGSTLATSIQKQTATQITSALTDNNGKIISLINQDSSGVQIAGKNIVLNGDTTVTGAFKVSQANITNGAIGTAQIGDAAITNAKIADLDVSKITGNVTNFIQSYWNGVYGSTTMNANGLSVQSGSMTTLFDSSGAHFAQGTRTAQYSFGNWIDNTGAATSAVGLYMGLRGDNNSFLDIIGPSGAAVAVIAGSDMADGANTNNVRGAINLFADTNIRSRLLFKGNDTVTSTYIEADEIKRTMNFYTDNAKYGNGNWFWFNHKVLSVGTFSSTSLLSKKNVIADYEEDALSEISKTDIVEFEYKNDVGEKHISPIIDDVNDEKDYYIPKTILSENSQYVDMYSMISMAWKAIKQLNEKIGDK